MNLHAQHSSATIYQFPVGGRSGLNGSHEIGRLSVAMPAASGLASADAWYHQVAIQQDAANPKGKQ